MGSRAMVGRFQWDRRINTCIPIGERTGEAADERIGRKEGSK